MAQDKILLVDNEMEIIQLLRLHLSREGYEIIWTTDSTKALDLMQEEKPDLAILDVVMPGLSGIELCSKMREESDIPILFLSCKNQEFDKVMGLSMGGDDYISKPFSPSELLARVRAHLRRSHLGQAKEEELKPKDKLKAPEGLDIDVSSHTVKLDGEELYLTATEFDLLTMFCKFPNRVFTTRQIFDNIWNDYGLEEDVRTVMVHISNLRKKLESSDKHTFKIKTVRGVGYKLVP